MNHMTTPPEANQTQSEPGKATVKLGRGLGRLIPVSAKNVAVEAAPKVAASAASIPSVAAPSKPTATVALNVSPVDSPKAEPLSGRQIAQVKIRSVIPNPRQPRMDFDAKAIEELADSIRSAGLIQPIVVRPATGSSGRYELIAGERRWRACQTLGWTEIPAIITNATDQDSGVWALIENVHRTDLNPMDRAAALQKLVAEFRLTHEALAEQLGMDRSSITNLLRLSELDSATADLVRKGHLTQGHAKALLGVSSQKTRTTLAESAVRGDWSVRSLEREVQRLSEADIDVPRGTPASRRRSNIDALERKLSQAIGTEVKIQTGKKPNTGKLLISFYSLEQFEGIVSRMGVKASQVNNED